MEKVRNLKAGLLFAAICFLPSEVVWAQGWAINDAPADSVYRGAKEAPKTPSVYEASTQAAEKPEIKTLNLEEFSIYAVDVCKKYQFEGPLEIKGQFDTAKLKKKLVESRKMLFTRLCDPEVRKDEALKSELQSQMKSLTEDIRTFPKLDGAFETLLPAKGQIEDVKNQINQKYPEQYITPMQKK